MNIGGILDYIPKRVDNISYIPREGDIIICNGGLVLLKFDGVYLVLGKVRMKDRVCLDTFILDDLGILADKLERYHKGTTGVLWSPMIPIIYLVVNIKELMFDLEILSRQV